MRCARSMCVCVCECKRVQLYYIFARLGSGVVYRAKSGTTVHVARILTRVSTTDMSHHCTFVTCRNTRVQYMYLQGRSTHAGRETGKLADKDLPAAVKSNSVLEFPTIWRVLAKIHSYPQHHGIPVLGC